MFPNTTHKPILLMSGDISQKQVATLKKKMDTVIKPNDIDLFTNSLILFCTNYHFFALSNVLKQTGIATTCNCVPRHEN